MIAESRRRLTPSPGTPGEGRGEGLRLGRVLLGPLPNPLPEYWERELRHALLLALLGLVAIHGSVTRAGSPKTEFDSRGFIHVNGKPFFPIGIYLYDLSPAVMSDIKAKHFN